MSISQPTRLRLVPKWVIFGGGGIIQFAMDTQFLRDKLPDILTGLKEISLVYLFGSRIGGRLGPMTDYDLGVLIDRGADAGQVHARFTHELVRALQTDRIVSSPWRMPANLSIIMTRFCVWASWVSYHRILPVTWLPWLGFGISWSTSI